MSGLELTYCGARYPQAAAALWETPFSAMCRLPRCDKLDSTKFVAPKKCDAEIPAIEPMQE
jgi:hypothetical protein